MSDSTSLPRTVDAWVAHLDGVALPVGRHLRRDLQLALHQPNASLRDIAQDILTSPALTLAVLREANRARPGSRAAPAQTLDTALARLGLRRAETLLRGLPVLGAEHTPLPLRQLQLIGQHASQQAGGLFTVRLARHSQEIQACSLLFFAPFWPLAMAHPELVLRWAARVFGEHRPARQVELELFGVPLVRLGLALARHWRLPPWIAQGYQLLAEERQPLVKALRIARRHAQPLEQQQALDADPALRSWLSHPANSALLGSALALAAHHAWDDSHSLRWQCLAGLYLQQPLDQVQQQIHRLAVISARQLQHRPDGLQPLWHPAQALLWPPGSRRRPPAEPAARLSSFFRAEDWQRQCGLLLQQPSPFANLPQLVGAAAEALHTCGLSRCVLLVADRQGQLIAHHQVGLAANSKRLTLDPGRSELLNRLLDKPQVLHLNPDNYAAYDAHLPALIKLNFPDRHLLLGTLGLNGRGVLLVVADQHGVPFAATQLRLIDKTLRSLERALLTFSQRAR